jgi:hypothetical protein
MMICKSQALNKSKLFFHSNFKLEKTLSYLFPSLIVPSQYKKYLDKELLTSFQANLSILFNQSCRKNCVIISLESLTVVQFQSQITVLSSFTKLEIASLTSDQVFSFFHLKSLKL